jgi:hypothetical protein
MFNKIKEFFTGKPAEVVTEVPYKVEASIAPVAEQATQAVVESIAPAKKPAAKKAPAVKKPAAKTAPAVKKPRAPKVAK